MRTKRIGERLWLLFVVGLFGVPGGDGPTEPKPDPEKVTVEFVRAPADGSIFVQPAGPDTAFTFVFRATSSRLGALTGERVIITVNGVEKTRGDSVQVNLPVNWTGIEVCVVARGQETESKACRSYKQYPRGSGRLVALLAEFQPTLGNRVLQFRNGTVRDSIRTATDATWVISTRAVVAETMEVEMRGDEKNFGSLDRVTPEQAAAGSIGILLVPRRSCITAGSFAGECFDIPLADYFLEDILGLSYIPRSNKERSDPTVWQINIKYSGADSVAAMEVLRENERRLGIYRFVDASYTGAADGTIELREDKTGFGASAGWNREKRKCDIRLGRFNENYDSTYAADPQTISHELGHCLGIDHNPARLGEGRCKYPDTVMASNCGRPASLVPEYFTARDVHLIHLLHSEALAKRSGIPYGGVIAAWQGYQRNGGI